MESNRWEPVIAALRTQSGDAVEHTISDAAVAQIEERFGINLPSDRRRFTSNLPSVEFEPGLTDTEVAGVENRLGFRFPPDLRTFLQTALPVGDGFPNWRSGEESSLREWLAVPPRGICFDIEHNGFWLPEWGPRPASLREAFRVCSELVAEAPTLIPIYIHRFIPDEPHLPGNPVFSVHQTDIIYYGHDLLDYLKHEFSLGPRDSWPDQVRPIRFWDLDRFALRWSEGPCVFWNK